MCRLPFANPFPTSSLPFPVFPLLMDTLLISYDICSPDRLRRVAQLLEDHGRRVQQSVFACALPADQTDALLDDVLAAMECPPDHLFVLPLCQRCLEGIEQHGPKVQFPSETDCYIA